MRVLPDRGYPRARYLRRVTEEQYKALGERLYGPETIDPLMGAIGKEDNKEDYNSEDDD
jgi:hypothetical protein